MLCGLTEQVVTRHGPEGWEIEVQGEIAALVALGLAKEKAPQPGLEAEALCSAKVRDRISEDAAFRYYDTVIARTARPDLRLYLYHFPGISGVPITPQVVRRLDERHPGIITGVKDSGGDADFTAELVRPFSHLSIFTGSETHLPDLIAVGARGAICGLANVMPRLMRALMDAPTTFDRRALLPALLRGDAILSRRQFIPAAKAVIADAAGDPEWRRVIPPLPELPLLERRRVVADFRAWDASLPPALRSLTAEPLAGNVIDLRRA